MRALSTFLQQRILSGSPTIFYKASIIAPGKYELRVTTLPYNVTDAQGNTWTTRPLLVSVDPPRFSEQTDREVYSVVFSGVDNNLKNNLANSAYGAQMRTEIGFFNPSTGKPEIDDTLVSYEGEMDAITVASEEDEILCRVSGASPLANLDAVNYYFASNDWVRNIDPEDSSMDHVGTSNPREFKLLWGKLDED